MQASDIVDLRSAMAFLATIPGQLVSTREPVDPVAELAGVYRMVGAGAPVSPHSKTGPAMLFECVKGYDIPVVTGILASRERTALLLNSSVDRLPFDLLDALNHPQPPVFVESAPCQEVVIRPPFDLRTLIPAPTNTLQDAGPYFNMGLLRAQDPETGEADVTIHRLCIQGPDLLSVYFAPGRHIDAFRDQGRIDESPAPRLHQHGAGSGHLPCRLLRTAHHAAWSRRTHHRRRLTPPPCGTGPLRLRRSRCSRSR